MAALLIAVIYLAFVSMGLPDSLLGSAWPTLYRQLDVPMSYAGIVTILIASGTVISSLLSDRVIRRFGTGKVAAGCTALVTLALFGFSLSGSFWILCLWALPYGLGAGSIDAALNNYVALHYKSRHMSWIHFFWGVGATISPYIMGALLSGGRPWNEGYRVVGYIQAAMALCLVAALPLWNKRAAATAAAEKAPRKMTFGQVLGLSGAKNILLAFFCYCALESTAGLWASSYMALERGVAPEAAARWGSLFFLGVTAGRFLCGFISDKIGDRNMVRAGQGLMIVGALSMLLPLGAAVCFAGLILIGLGCAPVYPCLLHETPANFGADKSQAIMGIQMASAYTGSTLTPPLFGLLAERFGIALLPVFLLALAVAMFALVESLNATIRKNAALH